MSFPFPTRLVAVLAAAMLMTSACTADINIRGNSVNKDALAKIRPGMENRAAVRNLLGSPTNISTFSNETWFYISQKDRTVAFSRPISLSREIVAISFDKQDRVAGIKQYSLANARKIKPEKRVTPTPGKEFGILEQLLGNLGRFEAPEGSGL